MTEKEIDRLIHLMDNTPTIETVDITGFFEK